MRSSGIAAALAMIGRRFIGGYKTRTARYYGGRSKYSPHQGARQAKRYAAMPDGYMDAGSRKRAGDL